MPKFRKRHVMPKFWRKSDVVEATQWFKNGDHPRDKSDRMRPDVTWCEGEVVRYFRHPDVPGTNRCGHCGKMMHDHGWIDEGSDGRTVCPGDWVVTGEGEYYPCKPSIFKLLYEPVESEK